MLNLSSPHLAAGILAIWQVESLVSLTILMSLTLVSLTMRKGNLPVQIIALSYLEVRFPDLQLTCPESRGQGLAQSAADSICC